MGFWKDKDRKHWCYKFEFQKKAYGARGFKTKKEAVAAREKHRIEVKKGIQIHLSMGFREVASLYLDDAKLRFTDKTYKYKASVYKSFLSFNGDHEISKITTVDIDRYLKTRKTNHNFNVHRKELSTLFNFAISHLELINRNPVSKIAKLPHNAIKKSIPPGETVSKILDCADPIKQRPFLLILLHLAARVDEVLRLTWEDIDFNKRTVTRWTKKRSGGIYEPIVAYMNDELMAQLEILKKENKHEKWLFFNVRTGERFKQRRKMLYGLCEKANVPQIHYHELRHYVASILADNPEVSKKTIQDILGHKSLSTTEIYLHSVDKSNEIALKSLNGKFT
jgi:integrase